MHRFPCGAGNVPLMVMFTHHTFFFTFYRFLFATISSASEFALMSFLQVCADLVIYCVMTLRPVHAVLRRVRLTVWSYVYAIPICCGCCRTSNKPTDVLLAANFDDYAKQKENPDRVELEWMEAIKDNSEDSMARHM